MSENPEQSADEQHRSKDLGPEAEEVRSLTKQFYTTLRASITKIEENAQDRPQAPLKRVHEVLKKSPEDLSWADAYDIEQQLIHLLDPSTLDIELQRRLVEAQGSLHPNILQWYEDRERDLTNEEDRRALLLRLVNDLQWRYTKNEARRGYTKQITRRTEVVFGVTVVVFLGLALCVLWTGVPPGHALLIPFAGAVGAWGAAFSMMTSLRSRLADSSFDDLKLNRSWGLIIARAMVGLGAAIIIYFFVRANLLQGGVFPSLKGAADAAGNTAPIPGAEFAKLMIWSFLAGFSEKLVPNLLARTEAQAGEQSQTVPHGRSGQARPGDQQPTEEDKPAAAEPRAQPEKRNGKK